ncbi:uncharacterized protein MYCFIDRAFT_84017 [Pseudocercospora fijiensis CIRAD86]|uniref:Uncharacterized protein n=1 Tax=Pseudocercospora fijiensis (strain CIRAD86) TaxID=383855 RepID=M3AJ52_PSEFD|nr:uncharacterized protein MYCFIDRAFT_84017 [Pseudocercospora fijiensis CIRAD86]EME77208.1 hypothetical protein MYCFIDRAFT_84017 [Pseudocercospora fijiensis CIRAD86]
MLGAVNEQCEGTPQGMEKVRSWLFELTKDQPDPKKRSTYGKEGVNLFDAFCFHTSSVRNLVATQTHQFVQADSARKHCLLPDSLISPHHLTVGAVALPIVQEWCGTRGDSLCDKNQLTLTEIGEDDVLERAPLIPLLLGKEQYLHFEMVGIVFELR